MKSCSLIMHSVIKLQDFDLSSLKAAIDKYQDVIVSRKAIGNLGHSRDGFQNLSAAAFIITALSVHENTLLVEWDHLDTPAGKLLSSLRNQQIGFVASARDIFGSKIVEEISYFYAHI